MLRLATRLSAVAAPRLACGTVQGRGCLAQVARGYSTVDMDVLDYLLKVEKDGEEYYRGLAEKATNPGFKRILTMLADDEARHYQAIEDMAHSGDTGMGKSTILKTTKSVFDQIRADPTVDLLAAKDQLELYAAARDLEARNRDEYIARASAASDPKVRALFELVANEEQKHYIMIDELIQFIQRDEEPDWESYRLDDSLYDNINRVDVA
uniref:Rubrerythrin diiron-binding domain-containing protein n=1 Tax=Eutreptiella gymnastica TaxID=73025 RepID=A0A7S4FNN2_9EUGL|eukprot:CAMPEP_0174282612 /NCGR_PEP_ID=MMETSP0809-20121228/3147_1 /TAXON_ID=73025 ORGANISM="Eutreptiella gymnastica-like, Strain CCMP1594" /NCGR_SAMPLE_ID=MMETSP0809 /ASSEMBLY_ACC=CAM_ASM_000658 /LENGTH=209 /DNA_ID=CAMNT_0015376949 /DNA_START=33 /DNA_END=662 /DNA_ORIENTATION=+